MEQMRATMPAVPAGMVRLAEYGRHDPALDADHTLIDQATGALHGYPLVRFQHITRGYVIAGSMMRWDEACWSVTYTVHDGGIHGKRFREDDEASARAYFAKITDPTEVSRMRQRAAMEADIEREEVAAAEVKAAAYTVEAAKTYRSGWQWRADYPGMDRWCGFAKTKREALAKGRAALLHSIRYAD
jgi:hypothetical protein